MEAKDIKAGDFVGNMFNGNITQVVSAPRLRNDKYVVLCRGVKNPINIKHLEKVEVSSKSVEKRILKMYEK